MLYYITEEYRDRKLQRYFPPGMSYADRDDIRQAFLIGCYDGIMKARLDIGDPLALILKKGLWATVNAIRSNGKKELQQECLSCQTVSRPNRVHGKYVCRRCGSEVKLLQRAIPHTEIVEVAGYNQDDQLMVEEFRQSLQGRQRDVFDLIMVHGYDRYSRRNYIREISEKLGITQSNVTIRLRQIKSRWLEYQTVV